MESVPLLKCHAISKSFGSNHVLKGINLDLHPGDVLSIIGGNGAGKSTLMKIIMGLYKCDQGEVSVNGVDTTNNNPAKSLMNGVYLVPQEPMLFQNMSVEENILLGLKGNKKSNKATLQKLLDEMGWEIDIHRQALTLSIAEQQLVEILKGLIRNSKILILDEPTSSLTFNEINSLFQLVTKLKNQGVGIIYITHRLNEVFEISNKVAIMSDGKITLEGPVEDFTKEKLIEALLPFKEDESDKEANTRLKADTKGEVVLKVRNLSGNGFSNISFDVHRGEVLGIAGVVGAGRTELAETIFGKDEVLSGNVYLSDSDITGFSTDKVIAVGLNYVPEDRFKNGIFKISDIGMNISSASLPAMGKFKLDREYELRLFRDFKEKFVIKATGVDQEIGALSGGNQQKIVIARALGSMPKVLILDEPTRGIDAGAREDVYRIIEKLKVTGVAVLLISSDMEEVVQLSDRAMTMHRGRINSEFHHSEVTTDKLMSASFGVLNGAG